MTDARDNILVHRAANLALKKLASTGRLGAISSSFRNTGQQQHQQQRKRLSAKDRLGLTAVGIKSRLGLGGTGSTTNGRQHSIRGRWRQNMSTNLVARSTNGFENFQIVANVNDDDTSEPMFTNRASKPQESKKVSLTRTIQNNLAAPDFTFSGRMNSNIRLKNFRVQANNNATGKRESVKSWKNSSPLFVKSMQDAERSREENDEIVRTNYQPVFDRLSSPKAKTSTKIATSFEGYVVRVTNLSSTVTEEDVAELFSSIGPLISSNLIRSGVGQAVFVRLADAKRAIAEFDKRELDGIAMKCVLTNQTFAKDNGKSNSTAAQTKTSKTLRQPRLSSSPNMNTESAIEVDRNLFNQAMFTNKNKPDSSGVQFTVKI